jgi:tetratricopeptide (TPR) repeat protein
VSTPPPPAVPFVPRSRRPLGPAGLAAALLLLGILAAPAVAGAAARPPTILDDAGFRADTLAGLERLYQMDFPGAERSFAGIGERFPDHPAGAFLRALVPWWSLLLDPDDTSHDAQVLAAMDEVVARADRRLRRDREDLDALFFKTGAFAFRARIHAYRGRWMKAALDGRRALSSLNRLHRREPDNDDLYFGLGLFDYLADVVPRQHPFLRPFALLLPHGDRRRGLSELERAATRGRFVQTEARYALFQLHMTFEKDYAKALADARWLVQQHPDNPLFQIAQGRVYAQLGLWAEATILFQQVAERQVGGQAGYSGALAEEALYWLARGEMAGGRYASALQYLDRLDYLVAERNYDTYLRAAGRLRRGMTYDALGRRDDAVRCYREVLAMNPEGDVRDRARELLAHPYATAAARPAPAAPSR